MATTPTPTDITLQEFTEILSRYPTTMGGLSGTHISSKSSKSESSLLTPKELDTWRLDTLPKVVKARGKPHLTKEELQKLLSCKMARGKRRMALPKHIASNDPSTVATATATALCHLLAGASSPSTELILSSLKELSEPIKGVGPATASYILAVIAPDTVPVFSDEAYRWIASSDGRGGWTRRINYDAGEYRNYVRGVEALVARLGQDVTAGDVEKVGFVLGKEGAVFRSTLVAQDTSPAAQEAGTKLKSEREMKVGDDSKNKDAGVSDSKKGGKRKAEDDLNKGKDAESSEPKPAVRKRRGAAMPKGRGRGRRVG